MLHIAPANPDLIGVDLRERYPHIRTALTDNRPAVSAVVPSVAAGVPVVSFAVPFETTSGRRIFAGAVDIRSSPLGAYLPHAIALAHTNANVMAMWGRFSEACDIVKLTDLAESQEMFAGFTPLDL